MAVNDFENGKLYREAILITDYVMGASCVQPLAELCTREQREAARSELRAVIYQALFRIEVTDISDYRGSCF